MLLLQLVTKNTEWIEQFYTGSFYKHLSLALRITSGWTPFPLGQFLLYSFIAGILFWIAWLVKKLLKKTIGKRQFALDFGFGTLTIISGFYFLFNFMWGLNYYRRPVHEIVKLDTKDFTRTELAEMSARLIEMANESRRQLTSDSLIHFSYPLSHEQILAKAPLGYDPLAQKYPELLYERPSVKSALAPEIMSYLGIAGIYFPFTGEAYVNMDPPPYLLPETVSHEMAHQIGIASESEANFVAFLACQLHPEPAFRYAGSLLGVRYTLNRLYQEDSSAYYRHREMLSPGVICDLEATRNYWNSFDNPIEIAGRYIHDKFLKANSQTDGVQSYSKVVDLLMGEFRKNGLVYEQPQQRELVLQE
ncbi:DUF3810 domain-containing protein [Adhaeribacter soli]|uniref:DUF3810 domain-containing protein n=1 Tax=Adhaeribacter soli TaxID=2607655 RepID=A0A5N1J595_9BACT|nr:DUF3810 domain-containing protein [Adhaeribacter soli]KAA9345874.1 DUF3810 domain-containing protein [Adhaeribacter soli]